MNFNNGFDKDWENEGAEPSNSFFTNGYKGGDKPPAQYFNWFWHNVIACIRELHTKLSNVDNTSDANKPVSTATQTALDGKANTSHSHAQSDITGLASALGGKANTSHTHAQSDVTGLSTALSGKADASHAHAQSDITGLSAALNGKASASHSHAQSDVTGLSTALSGKADTSLSNVADSTFKSKVEGCGYVGGATNLKNGTATGSLRSVGSNPESAQYCLGEHAFSVGAWTKASGNFSHAEGTQTVAAGQGSHAEGNVTMANGHASHAEGFGSVANGEHSHAEGEYTKASSSVQHVQGKYNIEDTNSQYAHIVGNGTDDDNCSNAHTLDWNGNAWFAGDVSCGADNKKAVLRGTTYSYTGDGTKGLSHPNSINLGYVPNILYIVPATGGNFPIGILFPNQQTGVSFRFAKDGSTDSKINIQLVVSVSGTTISFYAANGLAEDQLNHDAKTYTCIPLI